MRTNIIEISLVISNANRALPVIMQDLSSFNLIYRNFSTEEYDDALKLTLVCRAMSCIDDALLIESLKKMPVVEEVISIFQSRTLTNESVSDFEKPDGVFKIHANEDITHDILNFAETRLSEVYGPVTNLLLRSAAKKSINAGSLFLNLAKNLNEKQKESFLKNIQGLDEI